MRYKADLCEYIFLFFGGACHYWLLFVISGYSIYVEARKGKVMQPNMELSILLLAIAARVTAVAKKSRLLTRLHWYRECMEKVII
jgi:hypothetical protein